MLVSVYSPDTTNFVPFQVGLRRQGLTEEQQLEMIERLDFTGRARLRQSWTSPPMQVLWDDYEGGATAQPCDFPIPHGAGAIVMSGRARTALAGQLEPYGELLPLDCGDAEFWVLNVTHVVDALDAQASEWVPVDGEEPMLWREAFKPEQIADSILFRLPVAYRKHRTYATDGFTELVQRLGLTGFHSRPIWSSNDGIVR